MIEWIKITPETEFPINENIVFIVYGQNNYGFCYSFTFDERPNLYENKAEYFLTGAETNFGCCKSGCYSTSDLKESFTHYSIINLPQKTKHTETKEESNKRKKSLKRFYKEFGPVKCMWKITCPNVQTNVYIRECCDDNKDLPVFYCDVHEKLQAMNDNPICPCDCHSE